MTKFKKSINIFALSSIEWIRVSLWRLTTSRVVRRAVFVWMIVLRWRRSMCTRASSWHHVRVVKFRSTIRIISWLQSSWLHRHVMHWWRSASSVHVRRHCVVTTARRRSIRRPGSVWWRIIRRHGSWRSSVIWISRIASFVFGSFFWPRLFGRYC